MRIGGAAAALASNNCGKQQAEAAAALALLLRSTRPSPLTRLLALRLAEGPSGMRLMTDDERGELVTALKKKWDAVNSMYQQSSVLSLASLDTIGKVKRKEMYEAQLAQIEKDIEKLSKKQVYVAE